MRYQVTIRGTSPLIQHSTRGMDETHPLAVELAELAAKRGTNKTTADKQRMALIESELALWLDSAERVTIPPQALRSCIESAARKLKHGPLVREGLMVEFGVEFAHDVPGETIQAIAAAAAYTVDVVVQRNRVLRTRPKFDTWSCTFVLDVDPELIDEPKLRQWLDIAGRRLGLGDWRPEKSGVFGRFELERLAATE